MTNKKVLLVLFFLISSVYAIQDINITVRNEKGLCVRQINSDCQICDNETLTLDGTSDHVLYLERQGIFDSCLSTSEMVNQTILPLTDRVLDTDTFLRLAAFFFMLGLSFLAYRRIKAR
jgi:hypothetical protein